VQWTFGDRKWDGLLPPDETPVVKQPANGQVWSGNNRAVGGAAGALVGDGNPATPMRAAQIRDDLTPLAKAAPRDLLGVQLDDRGLFLGPWQKRLVATLTPAVVGQNKSRAELRSLVEKWEGRASVDSVSYRLVREFRSAVIEFAIAPIFTPCRDEYERFDWRTFHYEEALEAMLREKPPHLLDPRFADWDALLVAAADSVIANCEKQGVPLAQATWGRRNVARIRHAFANVMPAWMTDWLNMPAEPLPGDTHMPRVQKPNHGASERLVVSPGHEAEGIFHLPGGQSGHPLSPFYRAGFAAWARGEPTPLLPGETKHTLTLAP
jgi:penicillin amidase